MRKLNPTSLSPSFFMSPHYKNIMLWVLGIALLLPLFVQLNGGIYRDINVIVDSQGVLTRLPLPISLLVYFFIFAFLPSNFKLARTAIIFMIAMLAVCILSVFAGSDGATSPQRKLLMLVQVMLPLGGLLLGQLIQDKSKVIAHAFLVVLSVVVPLQLLATWIQGGLILTHYLYAFSIYSHFQYVTLIFVCAFVYCLTSLWDQYKLWLCVVGLAMSIYAVSSLSFLTIFAFFAFIGGFVFCKIWPHRSSVKTIGIVSVLIAAVVLTSYTYFKKMEGQRTSVEGQQGSYYGKFKELADGKIPLNLQERLGDWQLFGLGILETPKTLLVGHPQPMPREIRSSPHNFYIDLTYTFGVISLLPIISLIFYTIYLCMRRRALIPTETWWLIAIVFYLVVIDSNFKVTLRQPYPGIFVYFLWGILLSRLQIIVVKNQNVKVIISHGGALGRR